MKYTADSIEKIRKLLNDRTAAKENPTIDPHKADALKAMIKKDLIPQWVKVRDTLVINDIAMFASEVIKTGEEFNIREFRQFGRNLKRETNRMNIEKIRQLIGMFDVLSDAVLQKIHSPGHE